MGDFQVAQHRELVTEDGVLSRQGCARSSDIGDGGKDQKEP
jgi:hypothetical protein